MDNAGTGRSWLDRATLTVGIVSSIVTIALTVKNAETRDRIDASEASLHQKTAELDAEIRRRDATIDESKERVERYKWVYSILPDITSTDAARRSAALAIVRLALTKEEAEGLLAGLQQSTDATVRQAAKDNIVTLAAIDSAAIVTLVDQSNAANADSRRSATGKLEREYADSPTAIGLTLERLGPARIKALSPSGLINALYYLARSDPKSWTAENVRAADSVLPVVAAQQLGPQATAELASVKKVVEAARRT